MSDNRQQWLRDLLAIPLLVALAAAVVTFVLPRIFAPSKEITLSVSGPRNYLEGEALQRLEVVINGQRAEHLVGYEVAITNTGDVPLTQLPIRFTFESEVGIHSIHHQTDPPVEFGQIQRNQIDARSLRLTYTLLNPGDSDHVTLLTDQGGALDVFARAEGLALKRIQAPDEPGAELSFPVLAGFTSIVALLASAVTILARHGNEVRLRREEIRLRAEQAQAMFHDR